VERGGLDYKDKIKRERENNIIAKDERKSIDS